MGPSAKVPVASEVAGELDQRYEQLRAIALGGQAGSNGLGLGVLAGRGMAAWITVWRSEPPPASWVPAALRCRGRRPRSAAGPPRGLGSRVLPGRGMTSEFLNPTGGLAQGGLAAREPLQRERRVHVAEAAGIQQPVDLLGGLLQAIVVVDVAGVDSCGAQ
jgi:hypothetical protein